MRSVSHAYGTQRVVWMLKAAVADVQARWPTAPDLVVGDISYRRGGRIKRHKSHQSGRDADISFYYRGNVQLPNFEEMDEETFDAAKNWHLFKTLIDTGEVEYIFINYDAPEDPLRVRQVDRLHRRRARRDHPVPAAALSMGGGIIRYTSAGTTITGTSASSVARTTGIAAELAQAVAAALEHPRPRTLFRHFRRGDTDMAWISGELERTFTIDAPYEQVLEYFQDPAKFKAAFGEMEKTEQVDGGVWKWTLEEKNEKGISFQGVYMVAYSRPRTG